MILKMDEIEMETFCCGKFKKLESDKQEPLKNTLFENTNQKEKTNQLGTKTKMK